LSSSPSSASVFPLELIAIRSSAKRVGAMTIGPEQSHSQTPVLANQIHVQSVDSGQILLQSQSSSGLDQIAQSRMLAPPVVVDVLRRYPSAPPGGRLVGELIRTLDASLRRSATHR
jgi:hypothetical protein